MVKVLVGFIAFSVFMLFVGTLAQTDRIPVNLQTVQVASYCVALLIGLAGFVILKKFPKILGQVTGAFAIALALYIAFSTI
ncbi:MAG: hypothetical protein UV00_C0032G0014 [candidate division WWE3 bacterium GW2011_GWF1_42_14]|uniref:Uncharacterized protein n=1 Tax=candidate division WWE3 bacterium GW2011_GWF1_42_14 TaxID=1619138 RepID=A0A0G1BDY6_UNCKA|nr:MAG: hypothetical protein UV00_C0032G0014 [candidate division WWE3 bacterium GW2011_GWF1_42_14]